MRHAHPSIQPRTTTEAADDRNRYRVNDRSAGQRAGVGKVEQRRTGAFKSLGLCHQPLDHGMRRQRTRFVGGAILNAVLERGLRRNAELRKDRNPGAGDGGHRFRKVGRAIELDHVHASLFHQPDRGADCGVDTFLQRTVRKIAADQRPLDAAPHRLADHDHFLHRDLERIRMTPQIDADGIADRHDFDAGAVNDLRHLVIPGDYADDLFAIALHLL